MAANLWFSLCVGALCLQTSHQPLWRHLTHYTVYGEKHKWKRMQAGQKLNENRLCNSMRYDVKRQTVKNGKSKSRKRLQSPLGLIQFFGQTHSYSVMQCHRWGRRTSALYYKQKDSLDENNKLLLELPVSGQKSLETVTEIISRYNYYIHGSRIPKGSM